MSKKNGMSISVLVYQQGQSYCAHALDFDIVCESTTQDAALKKLRLAVNAYMEYAILNDQMDNLSFPAPQECWDSLNSLNDFKKVEATPITKVPLNMFWAAMMIATGSPFNQTAPC